MFTVRCTSTSIRVFSQAGPDTFPVGSLLIHRRAHGLSIHDVARIYVGLVPDIGYGGTTHPCDVQTAIAFYRVDPLPQTSVDGRANLARPIHCLSVDAKNRIEITHFCELRLDFVPNIIQTIGTMSKIKRFHSF